MNTSAKPQKKFDEHILVLNGMISGRIEPNPFQLKKIKMEVKKLLQDDPFHVYIILGMTACVEEDLEGIHHNHQAAINLCDNFEANAAYAVSLLNSDLLYEAYEQALKAEKLVDDDVYHVLEALDLLIKCCYGLEYEEELDGYLQQWKKIKNDDHPIPFLEDNSNNLAKMFDHFDSLIENHPEEIAPLDPEMMALADELVEGVELYE